MKINRNPELSIQGSFQTVLTAKDVGQIKALCELISAQDAILQDLYAIRDEYLNQDLSGIDAAEAFSSLLINAEEFLNRPDNEP